MDLEKEFNEKFSKGVSEVFLNPYEVSFSKSKFIHEKWFSSGTITFDNEFYLFFESDFDSATPMCSIIEKIKEFKIIEEIIKY
ncbi:MAG: hypothetical protein K2X69_02980 [Silvanigrellaceae bacterium]|nr:hypothetical protein [Silvanigrellaceae bacterium]